MTSKNKPYRYKINKRPRDDDSDDESKPKSTKSHEYEVWYWPLKNRGNFIRLLFAETGKDFKDCNDPKALSHKIKSPTYGNYNEDDNKDIYESPMAPPFIIHHIPSNESVKEAAAESIIISQSEQCVGYVSTKLGLQPDTLEDHYRAQNIVGNCNDLFTEFINCKSVSKANKWSTEPVKQFINGRWKIWMEILQTPLTRTENQIYYIGNKISQADIVVFNILNGFEELFKENGFNKLITEQYPILSSHYKRIGNREQIKSFLDKQNEAKIPWFPPAKSETEDKLGIGWSVVTKAIKEMLFEEWEIWYWPMKNRGNHIKLLFVEKGVDFKDVNDSLTVQKKIRSPWLGKWDDRENKDLIVQPMAPPFIIHRIGDNEPVIISQTEHCVGYVAEKLGLRPDKLQDHYRAQTIVANTNDLFKEFVGCLGQNTDVIKGFLNCRFKRWMDILQKPLTRNKDQIFYIGDKLSQADIAVFNILNGFETDLFGQKSFNKLIKKKYPILIQHYERIKNRENIKRFLKKQDEAGFPWYPETLVHVSPVGWEAITKVIATMATESKT